MREINYRLIVSDFDGTLLNSQHEIPEVVEKAINEYVTAGGIFAVCTGRMLKSILPRVRELGLKGLVAAYQGTVIADAESGEIIRNGGIGCSDAAQICKELERLGKNINVYIDDELYTNIPKSDKHLQLYEQITGIQANFIDGEISKFVISINKPCQKIACLVAPKERIELYKNLNSVFGDRFDVTCSAEVLVEVSPLNDNKGAALKFLADHYNVDLESTVAVGDNLNDLSMINAAGIGVAVGNAVDELKEAADFVAVTNDEGAVAQIIEKYGYK